MGHGLIIEPLLRARADIDARNALGQTPLHVAAAYGHEMEVQMLLGFGADPEIPDHDGLLAHHLARDNDETDVATLLESPERLVAVRGPRLVLPPEPAGLVGRLVVPAALAIFAIAIVRGSQ
jgi:ankyrin repeat protein